MDEFKLAILKHKATGWEEVEAAQVTGHLYALIQMVELPSEQTVPVSARQQTQRTRKPHLKSDPEDDVAPFPRTHERPKEIAMPFTVRTMTADDRHEVAELIYISINHWYQTHGCPADLYRTAHASCNVFFDVYEALDPDCGLVAEHNETGKLMASVSIIPVSTMCRWEL